MVRLHQKYRDQGLSVLGFPCNQFGAQEPKPEPEIKKFAQSKFGVEFDMFSKIDVNGDNTHPVYTFLKGCFPGDITWNFAARFLVDKNGVPVKRLQKETWEETEQIIQQLLAEGPQEEKSS